MDRTFGVNGVARPKGTTLVTELTALRGGGVAYLADDGFNRPLLGFLGVDVPRREGPLAAPFAVLPDGRFVEATPTVRETDTSPERVLLTRRLVDGRQGRSFGVNGRVVVTAATVPSFAAAADGRVAQVSGSPAGATLRLRRADAAADPRAPLRTLESLPSAFAFDARNRLVVALRSPSGAAHVRRLLADGTDDASFARLAVSFDPSRLTISPSGNRIVVAAQQGIPLEPLLADRAGRALTPSLAARDALVRSSVFAFDAQDRLVIVAGRRVLRVSKNAQRVETLRYRLPGGGRLGVQAQAAAVDRRGRLLLAGYRSFFRGADPYPCEECSFSPAETGGIVVRLEGGDRRIAIVSRRLGRSAGVRCLAAARRRCSGTLRLTSSRGSTVRRVRLAAGTTRSFAVPRGLRREAGSITVEARAIDATGELFTARRTLRR